MTFSADKLAGDQACCGLPAGEPPKTVLSETQIPVFDEDNCQIGTAIRQLCSDGTINYVTSDQINMEISAMGANFTAYKPTADNEQCRTAQVTTFEVVPGGYSVADIITAALAADPQNFDFAGTAVAAVPEDAVDFNIVSKSCGDRNFLGDEIVVDYMTVDGNNMVTFNDPADGGVDLDTKIEIPATGCAIVSICFKKCLDKDEIAAL